jgi:hypothetical protein
VSVGTTVQSATTLALPGAATVERFENDPTTLVAGTLTNPSLTTIAVGGDGTMTAVDTRPMTSAVFGIATALECVLAVQPSKLLFFDKELNLITETSVPSITNVLAHNTVVYAHAGNDILFFTIDPVTCTGSPTENPPIAVPNLRDFEVSEEGDLFLGLERPLAGPSRLHVFPADGGVPTGGATIVTLPGSAFDVEITPGGNRAYLMGDLGQVTWATVEKANATVSVQGQFTLSGADRFELVDAAGEPQLRTTAAAPGEVRIIYTRVSNPSLGQLCTAVLGTDGVPKAAAVCEEGSTRPRPDSDLRVLKPAPAALRTAFPVGRRASR